MDQRIGAQHVLVVEDNEVHRVVAATFLEQLGHTVAAAASGEAALEHARHAAPDVVLMDISLPGMDGLTAARHLRERLGPATPIVAMSAHVFRTEIETYRRTGMDAVIIKPVSPESLNAGLIEGFAGRPASIVGDEGGDHGDDGTTNGPAPVIDRAELAADIDALGTDAAARMMRLYLESGDERAAVIRRAAEAGDADEVERAAHDLKSAARSLALNALAEACAAAERTARNHPGDDLMARARDIEAEHARAREAIRAWEREIRDDASAGE